MKRPVVRFCLDAYFAGIGELNGIADEIDQDLRQAAAITMTGRQFESNLDFESELFVSRQRLQRAAEGLGNTLDAVTGQFEHDLAGLDLGQMEHVIDHPEQVPAVGLKPFEYAEHLLRRLTICAVRH